MKRTALLFFLLCAKFLTAQQDSLYKLRLAEIVRIKAVFQSKTAREDSLFTVLHSDEHAYQTLIFDPQVFPTERKQELLNAKPGEVTEPWRDNNKLTIYKIRGRQMSEDSVEVRHILITYKTAELAGPSVRRKKWEAKKLADSLCAVIQSGKTPMTALVLPFTDDAGSRNGNLGDYGMFTRNSGFITPFKNAGFNNPVGAVVVVESEFGFHVIQVVAKNPAHECIAVVPLVKYIDWNPVCLRALSSSDPGFSEAVFPGGNEGFMQYLRDSLRYPPAERKAGREEAVKIVFRLDENGKVTNVAGQGADSPFKAEAVRLVTAMPAWDPGRSGGKPVPVVMVVWVVFSVVDF